MAMRAKEAEGTLTRRTFLATSAGAGLVMGLGVVLPGCSRDEAVEEMVADGASKKFAPTVWFEVNGNGEVVVNIAKAEMGQHVGTALARIVADELGANWDDVSISHVDSDPKWGFMLTGGSWSVFTTFTMLSQAGAAGRTILRDAGAALLGVAPQDATVVNGQVSAGGDSISFADIVRRGDIARSFSDEELAAMPVKAASERTLIGKPARALDIPEKSVGDAVYGIDVEIDGMVFAHPLMPPTRYGSTIRSIDDAAARDIRGYIRTLKLEDPSEVLQGWAVVIAEDYPAAMRAAEAVVVDWEPGPTADVSEADLIAEGTRLASDKASGVLAVDEGDVAAARAAAASAHSATYTTSTALHFTLEPANALVEFKDGKCHVHSGNQWQSLILPVLAESLQMDEADIVIHQYYLGGGYGRRLWGDPMFPAALAAKELGRPVKIVFQRADDSRFDCCRSASVQQFDASFDADGNVTGIEHALAAGWPTLAMAPGFMSDAADGNGKFDPFATNGADHWYTLANHRVRSIKNDLAQRTFLPGWLRSVGPGWITWGVETFMDELAYIAGKDPIEFRLAMLRAAGKNAGTSPNSVGGAKRLAAVLEEVRERSGWDAVLPENEGLGVATCVGQERNMPTWIACVAHVAVDAATDKISVRKIWQTIDCGTVVHPDGAMAQAEGAALWGLSIALHEGATFVDGQVAERNLDTYAPLRMADVPELDIEFVESTEFPTGLGEPPLIPVAPAIGNAVFSASGVRARDLPIRL